MFKRKADLYRELAEAREEIAQLRARKVTPDAPRVSPARLLEEVRLLERLALENLWQPLVEHLPAMGERVLVFSTDYPGGKIHIGQLSNETPAFFRDCMDGWPIRGVTYWRKLPEPPRKEEK